MARGVTRYDEAQLQGRLWTVEQLTPALVSWYDANDPTTITTVGSNVSEWLDKSGNNRHVTQSNGNLRPTYSASGLNGRPAVVWPTNNTGTGGASGSNQVQLTWTGSAYSPIRSYAVAQWPAKAAADQRAGLFSNNYTQPGDIFLTVGRAAGSTSDPFWDPSLPGGGFHNGSSVVAINTYNTVINPFVISTNVSGSTNRTQLWIGNDRNVGQRGWTGLISEFIQISIVPTLRERNLIEGYLAWKWGISLVADHPFANRPPLIGD